MTDLIPVIAKVLPVIFLIITGSIIRRMNFLKQSTVDELKKIVVNISLPALLFFAFAATRFEKKYLLIFAAVFFTCAIMLLIGSFLKKASKSGNRYMPSLFSGFETGMMGYSIYVAVYGTENMYKLAVMDLGQVTFVFFVLVTYLQKQNGSSAGIRDTAVSFIKSPVILSIAAGILVGATGILGTIEGNNLSNSVIETLRLLSDITVPVICIVIGYELRIDFKNLRNPLFCVAARIILLMVIAAAINDLVLGRLMHLDNSFKVALYTLFLLPPPFIIPIYMKDKEVRNKQFILNAISLHIILTLFAYLLLIMIMK